MTKQANNSEPQAWTPGVFGMHNQHAIRDFHEQRWESEAKQANSERPLHQKLLGKGRVGAEDVMRDEANRDNTEFDRVAPGMPDSLYLQELGKGILKESGIEQPNFASANELEEALMTGHDRSYGDRREAALDKLPPVVHPGEEPPVVAAKGPSAE